MRKTNQTAVPPRQFRQGDVLITYVDRLPGHVAVRPRDHGRVILAYGEVTGHAHVIDDTETAPVAAIYDEPGGDGSTFYLRLEAETGLVHEEHGRIDLPAGVAVVTRQREYTPEAIRRVAD